MVVADLRGDGGGGRRPLSAPWIEDGTVWWLEGRASEAGRVVLVRRDPDGTQTDVVPGFNIRTSVHEYGGGAYCIHRGIAFVSNFDDQRLYRVDPGAQPRRRSRPRSRTDGTATPTGGSHRTVSCGSVRRERHAESDSSKDVERLVVLPTDGSASHA